SNNWDWLCSRERPQQLFGGNRTSQQKFVGYRLAEGIFNILTTSLSLFSSVAETEALKPGATSKQHSCK
ncbi:hypothetical protein ABVT39_018277, partial [Epinephelus coioides]